MGRQIYMSNIILEKLLNYDTPSITNVVATYPNDTQNCLGLYHPWEGKWYTDQTLKCMYPELGRRVGYVVTCVYGLPDPNFKRLKFVDLLRVIKKSPQPVILAVKQNLPEKYKDKAGLLGGNMMATFKAVGVVGVLTDGPSRDVDEVRPLGVQYMLTGVTPGHGEFELEAINVPVEICGMCVSPGDIAHMDENGVTKFPAEYLEEVEKRVAILQNKERSNQKLMLETNDLDELANLVGY
jgi:4-hydroxy-4-methyl-2-oxoglutarate aldolase